MKMTSFGRDGERNGLLGFSRRWGSGFLRQRALTIRAGATRTIEFALERNALWRIAGNVRDVRIDCRQGRLWLTQAGTAADVILQPGQKFVANAAGAIVVQSMPPVNAREQAALGSLTLPGDAARLRFHRGQRAGAIARIGMNLRDRDPGGIWEQWAFLAVWLCSAFGVWYCLKLVLPLP